MNGSHRGDRVPFDRLRDEMEMNSDGIVVAGSKGRTPTLGRRASRCKFVTPRLLEGPPRFPPAEAAVSWDPGNARRGTTRLVTREATVGDGVAAGRGGDPLDAAASKNEAASNWTRRLLLSREAGGEGRRMPSVPQNTRCLKTACAFNPNVTVRLSG